METCLLYMAMIVSVMLLLWIFDFEGIRSKYWYLRAINSRVPLDDHEFYMRFYEDTQIPFNLVCSFRRFYASYWGEVPELIRPDDDLFCVNSGEDFADWAMEAEVHFGVMFPERLSENDVGSCIDANTSFDSMLRYIYQMQNSMT